MFDFTVQKKNRDSPSFDFTSPRQGTTQEPAPQMTQPRRTLNELPKNFSPDFAKEHPTATKVLLTIAKPLRAFDETPAGKFLTRASEASNEVRFMTENPNKTDAPYAGVADFIGGMTGFIGGPGPAASAGKIAFDFGGKAGKLFSKPVARTAAEMAGGSVAFDFANAAANNKDMSAKEIGTVAAQNAALGVIAHGVGRLFKPKGPGPFDFTKPKDNLPVPEREASYTDAVPLDDVGNMQDISGFQAYTTDPYRNMRDVLGEKLANDFMAPFNMSKRDKVDFEENWLNRLKTEVVDRLGIKKGSDKSALVQRYGEGNISLAELQQQRPHDWKDIVEADSWFRRAYDELIDRVNAVKEQIYPGALASAERIQAKIADLKDPYKWTKEAQEQAIAEIEWELKMMRNSPRRRSEDETLLMQSLENKIERIKQDPRYDSAARQVKIKDLEVEADRMMRRYNVPKRRDYYRHFQELEGFAGLRNIFDSPAQIDPHLMGLSDFTLPKSKWASFMQKRGMGAYKEDAVGGFLNYLPSASYSIHIDPHISRFLNLAEDLSEATVQTKHLNNFIGFLRRYAQDLAGKTNPMDRFIQDIIPGGRATFAALNWLNNRIKANMVLANASSALSQLANIPQGVAFAGRHSIQGAGQALASILRPNRAMTESAFLKERFHGKAYRQFDVGMIDDVRNMAVWVMETADRIGTSFIWNSAHAKAVAEGIPNPIQYADNATRQLVAGRGIGEVSLVQKSKLFQLVAPFTVEVANLWHIQRDFIKAKDFGALATLYLGAFLFNRAMEQVRGSGVVFDPIDAMWEALTEDDLTLKQRGGRLVGEVLSNIPLGQTAATMLPMSDIERKQFFGREDPTRFGSSILVAKGIQDPFFKMVLPFGGYQLEKTYKGLNAVSQGGVYSQDGTQLKYPVSADPANVLRGALFGTGGFKETRDYYNRDGRPLTEQQTADYQRRVRAGRNPGQVYGEMMVRRQLDEIDRQIAEVRKDKKLTAEQRSLRIIELNEKRRKIMGRQ